MTGVKLPLLPSPPRLPSHCSSEWKEININDESFSESLVMTESDRPMYDIIFIVNCYWLTMFHGVWHNEHLRYPWHSLLFVSDRPQSPNASILALESFPVTGMTWRSLKVVINDTIWWIYLHLHVCVNVFEIDPDNGWSSKFLIPPLNLMPVVSLKVSLSHYLRILGMRKRAWWQWGINWCYGCFVLCAVCDFCNAANIRSRLSLIWWKSS